jgi:hypothetical protein
MNLASGTRDNALHSQPAAADKAEFQESATPAPNEQQEKSISSRTFSAGSLRSLSGH